MSKTNRVDCETVTNLPLGSCPHEDGKQDYLETAFHEIINKVDLQEKAGHFCREEGTSHWVINYQGEEIRQEQSPDKVFAARKALVIHGSQARGNKTKAN